MSPLYFFTKLLKLLRAPANGSRFASPFMSQNRGSDIQPFATRSARFNGSFFDNPRQSAERSNCDTSILVSPVTAAMRAMLTLEVVVVSIALAAFTKATFASLFTRENP
jgi:hypothetical protein